MKKELVVEIDDQFEIPTNQIRYFPINSKGLLMMIMRALLIREYSYQLQSEMGILRILLRKGSIRLLEVVYLRIIILLLI